MSPLGLVEYPVSGNNVDAANVIAAQCDAESGTTFVPIAEALQEGLNVDDTDMVCHWLTMRIE